MSDTVIQVENLGKKYIIGHQQEGNASYTALRDVISDRAKSLARRLRHPGKLRVNPNQEEFWALKDVSFEVKRGEVVGIIGRNGAGKSTLLKILSRITEPTEGRVRLRGRVASLLEVGTGFHPELTGRENIFLNGAILGMSRVEIKRKFDEIVDFAEVERFLDTPVKRYSSGMYVRLAFAVAAHLEPEILVVDEVLAVGDSSFQKKCLGKMKEVGQGGRTVIFVSHNIAAIENLCSSGLMLSHGSLVSTGRIGDVISTYINIDNTNLESDKKTQRSGLASLETHILGKDDTSPEFIKPGEEIIFSINLSVDTPIKKAGFGLGITTLSGERIITFHTHYQINYELQIKEKANFTIEWKDNFLCPNNYLLVAALYSDGKLISSWENAGELSIISADYFGTGKLPDSSHQGNVLANSTWKINLEPTEKQWITA